MCIGLLGKVKGTKWTAEEVGLQAAAEKWQKWCGHDMARQNVSEFRR